MTRARAVAVLTAVAMGALVLSSCGSSKSSSTTATTGSSGGVTVTTGASGAAVTVVASDTKGLDGPMTLAPSPASAPAGDISFTVKNTGTIEHEMIVLKTDTPFDKLPVVDAGDPPAPVKSGADKV